MDPIKSSIFLWISSSLSSTPLKNHKYCIKPNGSRGSNCLILLLHWCLKITCSLFLLGSHLGCSWQWSARKHAQIQVQTHSPKQEKDSHGERWYLHYISDAKANPVHLGGKTWVNPWDSDWIARVCVSEVSASSIPLHVNATGPGAFSTDSPGRPLMLPSCLLPVSRRQNRLKENRRALKKLFITWVLIVALRIWSHHVGSFRCKYGSGKHTGSVVVCTNLAVLQHVGPYFLARRWTTSSALQGGRQPLPLGRSPKRGELWCQPQLWLQPATMSHVTSGKWISPLRASASLICRMRNSKIPSKATIVRTQCGSV